MPSKGWDSTGKVVGELCVKMTLEENSEVEKIGFFLL